MNPSRFPTISVIIPAYNAERFLPRCIASVRAQTLTPHEIIVVDDSSTDNTAALAKQLGAHVITRPNGGVAAARNTGIRNASGDWIALLDADDLWAPEKLERQAECIRPGIVLVYTGMRTFDDQGTRSITFATEPAAARKMLTYRNPIVPSAALIPRELCMKTGGFLEDTRACEDWEMWVRLRAVGDFAAVREPLTDYFVYPSSLSASPEIMLVGLAKILPTLLAGFRGLRRTIWSQRIRAVQLCSAGLIARDNHLDREVRYMLASLAAWPSPFWQPRRFAMFAISLKNRLARGKAQP